MKFIKHRVTVLFAMIVLLALVSGNVCFAANTRVCISVHPTIVANLNYLLVQNHVPITEDASYLLLDINGKAILGGDSEKEILQRENVPFGNYTLRVIYKNKNYDFSIRLNDEHVKMQHERITLELKDHQSENVVKTGDRNDLCFVWGIMLLSLFVVIIKGKEFLHE